MDCGGAAPVPAQETWRPRTLSKRLTVHLGPSGSGDIHGSQSSSEAQTESNGSSPAQVRSWDQKSRIQAAAAKKRLLVFCAGPSLERSRPLLRGLEDAGVSVQVRTDEDLGRLEAAPEEAPACAADAVLVLWSQFFQGAHEGRLIDISERAGRGGALLLNDVRRLADMQDRRWLLKRLREHAVPTPGFVECSREGGSQPVLEEHEDHIMISGQRIGKPFVEKPVDRRDREIYVYYPTEAGGGRALISTRESGDVEYVCRFESVDHVRREGSFIYQEYLQSEGFVVQATCVGGLAYGNAVHTGIVNQPGLSRSDDRAGHPCPVFLRQEEKLIASKLNVLLHQTLFGITFVRSQTARDADGPSKCATSYVIDVWPGIPRSGLGAHRDDVVRALRSAMDRRLPMPGMHMRSRSLPKFDAYPAPAPEAEEAEHKPLAPIPEPSGSFDESDTTLSRPLDCRDGAPESSDAELLCVLLVARHSERTPKQKVKAKVTLGSEFAAGWLCGWLTGSSASAPTAVAPADSLELRSPQQLERLAGACRQLQSDGHDVGTLTDALGCVSREGITCHAKIANDAAKLVVGLKWGGELTAAGVEEAEAFGAAFRCETYPEEIIDELHATLRHDVKVYASREPRCQQTAAAFCKGLLRLSTPLPPIIAALVRTDNFDRAEDKKGTGKSYVEKAEASQSSGGGSGDSRSAQLPANGSRFVATPWAELEAMAGGPCVDRSLHEFGAPGPALQALRELVQRLSEALQADFRQALYGAETPALLRERYRDALCDLGPSDALRFDKAAHILDHLQYDHRHNRAALPEAAAVALGAALPLCEALCNVAVPLEAALERRARLDSGGKCEGADAGLLLLNKLRWDLRVASGADLGDETTHLQKHEALYAAPSCSSSGLQESQPACVRTRLYFTHNSRLQGMLRVLRGGASGDEEPDALVPRLGFLAYFVVRLWRRRSDGALRVSCDFARSGGDARCTLFDLPLTEVDAWWSRVMDARAPKAAGMKRQDSSMGLLLQEESAEGS